MGNSPRTSSLISHASAAPPRRRLSRSELMSSSGTIPSASGGTIPPASAGTIPDGKGKGKLQRKPTAQHLPHHAPSRATHAAAEDEDDSDLEDYSPTDLEL